MSTSTTPIVSIGLPVYNGANYLAEAIDSVLAQTYSNFELIISDNASTDETPEICQRYAAQDSRIRYFKSDVNKGAAWNYNFVVEQAKGQYFKWAAHDDVCAPQFLEYCVDILEQESEVAVCYSKSFVIDGDGKVISKYSDGLHIRDPKPHRRLRRYMQQNFMRRGGMCNPVFGLIRIKALKQTSLIQSFVASDRSLLAQLAVLGDFYELHDYLFKRRVHQGISTFANRDLGSRQAWFAAGEQAQLKTAYKLSNNHLLVRYRQVRDIVCAIARFNIRAKAKFVCFTELARLFITDPKWIYIDLKYSLGLGPTKEDIMNGLTSNNR